ncbi:MAG: hypothetical protein H6622_07065 [Halobacteriovoraceae bacterium]|nr:hypothetical protein [Halobacteriovoraceae bacterium]
MYLKLIIFYILSFSLFANNWLCTETASQRIEKNIYFVCGISENSSLQKAREEAMNSAYREFEGLCKYSYDCDGREKTISPLRTHCEKTKDGLHRCFRGFRFFITENKIENDKSNIRQKGELSPPNIQIDTHTQAPQKKTITSLLIGVANSEIKREGQLVKESLSGPNIGIDFQYIFAKNITGGFKYSFSSLEEDFNSNYIGSVSITAFHIGMNYYFSDSTQGFYTGLYFGRSSINFNLQNLFALDDQDDSSSEILLEATDFSSLANIGWRYNFKNSSASTILEMSILSGVGENLDYQIGFNTSLAFRY